MKIKEILKDKRAKYIIPLIIVVIVLIVLRLIPINQENVTEKEILPTPTISLNNPTVISYPTNEPPQGDPDFYENIRPKILENYPLFDFIPYKTENLSIDYLKPLVLEIKLKKDTPEIRQEVLDWILSKGVDPKTHKIIWETQ